MASGNWFFSISCLANFSSSLGVHGGLIFRKSAPRVRRSRCGAMRKGLPFTTRSVSNSPSPSRKPRSFTGTTASASDKNCPLRKTTMESIPNAPSITRCRGIRRGKMFSSSSRLACGMRRQVQRCQKTGGLRQRFLVFRFGIRIGNDARADVEMRDAVPADGRADGNVQLAFAVEAEIAHRAAVRPARNRLEFVNDLHRAEFRRTRDAATGKTRRERGKMRHVTS